MISKPRRSHQLAIAGVAVAMVAMTACSSSGGTTSSNSSTTAGGSGFTVPSQSDLQAGLLSLSDAGEPFTQDTTSQSSSDTSKVSGCDSLNSNLSQGTGAGVVKAEVDLQGGDTGPFFSEQLVSEPDPQFSTDLSKVTQGLSSCKSITINSSGSSDTLTLAPATGFPSGATAVTLSGSVSGTAVTGDLIAQKVGDAALLVITLQIAGATSVDGPTLFNKALQKAQSSLSGSSS